MEQQTPTPAAAGAVAAGAGAPRASPFFADAGLLSTGHVSDIAERGGDCAAVRQLRLLLLHAPTRTSPQLPNSQVEAATLLTPLAEPAHPHPSPLRRRGYFTDVHSMATFSRVPSLFGRLDDRNKPLAGGTLLPPVGCSAGWCDERADHKPARRAVLRGLAVDVLRAPCCSAAAGGEPRGLPLAHHGVQGQAAQELPAGQATGGAAGGGSCCSCCM